MVIARNAPDQMGSIMAAGLSMWIAIEAYINMAVMVNLLPFAGNALPMISAGGSNLVMTLAAIGMLINISRLSAKSKEAYDKQLHPVVNLRGGDGGWRVSGARRPASAAVRGKESRRTGERG
jgi:cell division protein FtsW